MNEHVQVEAACPKQMRFGPCGGVRTGGACEVDARPCPFVDGAVATPPARRAVPLPFVTSERTLIVDVRAPRKWNGDARSLWRATAAALDGSVALLGEHVDNPSLLDDAGALAPEEVVGILARAGVATVVTITGRDRDIDGASRRIARYRDAGAAAIHCVTGDHPLAIGLERPTYFGAEAMTLIGAATDAGMAVTVGESPASPGARAERVRAKAYAGAAGCILNHAGSPDDVVAFVDTIDRYELPEEPFAVFAPVPLVTNRQNALTLNTFPGLCLPPGYLDTILASPKPEEEGLRLATTLAAALFASHRFTGLNLSGGGHRADPYDRLRMTARYIDALRSI